jgi:hypothetical protein
MLSRKKTSLADFINTIGTFRNLTEILECFGKRTFLPLCLNAQPLKSLATRYWGDAYSLRYWKW